MSRRPLSVAALLPLLTCLVSCAGTGAPPAAPARFAGVSTPAHDTEPSRPARLPWREAGLTERQAAAHLLDRFTFGARPGEIDAAIEIGLVLGSPEFQRR